MVKTKDPVIDETELSKLKQVINEIFTTAFPDDHYRFYYIKGSNDRYYWTINPTLINGHQRFMSGIRKYVKCRNVLIKKKTRYHALRKDAKARAKALHNKAKGV